MCLTCGILLTCINLYGLFQPDRVTQYKEEELRFKNDQPLPFSMVKPQLKKAEFESNIQYSVRLSKLIDDSIAHIHWNRYNPEKFNQRVPIWDNYFLYFVGKFSDIPEFTRYHFANYERSLKRGIGVCGDASMIMSQILHNNGIANQIVSFPGHVIIEAEFESQSNQVFDPDFGIHLPYSLKQIKDTPSLVDKYYLKAGYTQQDVLSLNTIYSQNYTYWRNTEHFITNKFYFEKITYFLKWPLPLIFIFIAVLFLKRRAYVKLH